jgi:hypothetical protein
MMTNAILFDVIAGLDPAIHDDSPGTQAFVGLPVRIFIIDARVKPAHDAGKLG